eukprot:GHVO01010180.1.p1 GENE.GHVO01010180.1~~GHVO01010180.1.p1  ORF type:complete len:213 (+),score=30.05 GHVO01010180.1:406-1044(+)
MIEATLKEEGFSVKLGIPPKRQALKGIEFLCTHLPTQFARAKMIMKISCTETQLDTVIEFIEKEVGKVDRSTLTKTAEAASIIFSCPYQMYRAVESFGRTLTPPCVLSLLSSYDSSKYHADDAVEEEAKNREAEIEAQAREDAEKLLVVEDTRPRCHDCDWVIQGASLRDHCRSGWHLFNVKRLARGMPPCPQDEYDSMTRDIKDTFAAVVE